MEHHRCPDCFAGDREIGMIGSVAPEQIEVAGLQIFDVRQVTRRQLAGDAVAVPIALDDRLLDNIEEREPAVATAVREDDQLACASLRSFRDQDRRSAVITCLS